MNMPTPPKTGDKVINFANAVIQWMRANQLVSVTGGRLKRTPNGVILDVTPGNPGPVINEPGPCMFGETFVVEEETTIRQYITGGVIICGTNTWQMDDYEVDTMEDGRFLVSFTVDAVVNRDDDDSVLLPGVESGTKPDEWTLTEYTGTEDYPSGTNPVIPTGEGTVILPVGVLSITAGYIALTPTGCGLFRIEHCGGTLAYVRE